MVEGSTLQKLNGADCLGDEHEEQDALLDSEGEALLARMFGSNAGSSDLSSVHPSELSFEQAQAILKQIAKHAGPSAVQGAAPIQEEQDILTVVGPGVSSEEHLKRLRAAELRYRALMDNVPAVTFIAELDGDHNELYISPQIESMLGFTQAEWLADPFLWYYRVHPDDRERWGQEFARTCATGVNFRSEYRLLARDGHVVWIHGECQIIRDDNGYPRFLQGIAFDVTDTKVAEEALRRSHDELEQIVRDRTEALNESNRSLRAQIIDRERTHRQIAQQNKELKRAGDAVRESEGRLRAIFEAAVEGIISIDDRGIILSCNAAAIGMFGYALEEVLGQNVKMLMPFPYRDEHDTYLEAYRNTGIKNIIGTGREVLGLRKDGRTFPLDLSISEAFLSDRKVYIGMVRDISERKRIDEELRQSKDAAVHAALHDKLTGLPNRALMQDRLTRAIERRKRSPDYHFALLFLDFDRFKIINDSLGHEVGDDLLKEIAGRLSGAMRTTDSISSADSSTTARLGGDEFVILADNLNDPRDAAIVAERLLNALSEPYELRGHSINSTVSIGITTSDAGYERSEDMLRDADTAMYHAKAAGKARFAMFDRKMHQEIVARLSLENDLRHAIDRRELVLHYQPIVSLSTNSLYGFEALIRWNHPVRGMVSPADFIPCCEETGVIIPIGYWALDEACHQMREWRDHHPQAADFSMSVNLSAKQLLAPGLVAKVGQIVAESGIDPASIILEITETVMIKSAEICIPVLEQLRRLGVRLHMDDFGTGYSSLSCLHRFPLNGLKIDRSFVKTMTERRDYAAIVNAIIALGRNLGIMLIAEGLETADQVVMLQAMDCDLGQGYFFSRPVNAAAAEEFIQKQLLSQTV
jgi:diguanylate cyclase (GGDEF)-like protein/PAS domain S-box-containing protein